MTIQPFRFTLLGDGASDRSLVPILDWTLAEIGSAAADSGIFSYVLVVPVQMTETWLLIDEAAIRMAAGNPHGRVPLDLPSLARLERLPDPKGYLHERLRLASEKSGRRLDQFQRGVGERVQRVAALIEDFSPLRHLAAFAQFERTARETISNLLAGS